MPRSTNILLRFSPRTVVGFSILFQGQSMRIEKSERIRLDDLLAFQGDIKQDWDARTTIIFVGSFERQFCLFPLWLARHVGRQPTYIWQHRSEFGPKWLPRDRNDSACAKYLNTDPRGRHRQMAKGHNSRLVSEHSALKRRKTEDDDSSNPQSKKARTRVRYVSPFSSTGIFSVTPQFLVWRMPSAQAKGSINALYTTRRAHHISLV